jgi:hypothetical protein
MIASERTSFSRMLPRVIMAVSPRSWLLVSNVDGGSIVPFTEPGVAKVRHSDTTNGYIIAAMRVMKLLAIGGVTAAAGATISCGLRYHRRLLSCRRSRCRHRNSTRPLRRWARPSLTLSSIADRQPMTTPRLPAHSFSEATLAFKRLEVGQSAGANEISRHVRYWHKADIPSCTAHVRFWGKADMAENPLKIVKCCSCLIGGSS